MGVAGSGKSTVGKLFAEIAGATFYEGDDFHPAENIAKMRSGIPLTDVDRERWLQRLRETIAGALAREEFSVLACSALKAKYRDTLAAGDPRVRFVHLTGPPALLKERLTSRPGHFMPPSLLESQLAILEPPPDALVIHCEEPPQEIVAGLLQELGLRAV